MDAVERLRRDHGILRAKLDVLESSLGIGPEAWYVLREVCFTLARQLGDHIKREEDLVAECRQVGSVEGLEQILLAHRDEPEQLRALNQLFLSERSRSLDRIRPMLADVIRRLRRHMSEEEAELFPLLERTLTRAAGMGDPGFDAGLPFDETATVNQVVREFPGAREVFERLFINVPLEGCTCLDEVAWRHGMETRELLAGLKQAIGPCACPADRPAAQPERVQAGAG